MRKAEKSWKNGWLNALVGVSLLLVGGLLIENPVGGILAGFGILWMASRAVWAWIVRMRINRRLIDERYEGGKDKGRWDEDLQKELERKYKI